MHHVEGMLKNLNDEREQHNARLAQEAVAAKAAAAEVKAANEAAAVAAVANAAAAEAEVQGNCWYSFVCK